MNALDHSAIDSQPAERGEKTLGDAVSRIDTVRVAPFGGDVTMPNDDPVRVAAPLWQRAEHAAKSLDLRRKIRRDCARLRLRVSQRLIEQRTVHADFFRLASQPGFSGYRIIGRVFLFLRMNRQSRK